MVDIKKIVQQITGTSGGEKETDGWWMIHLRAFGSKWFSLLSSLKVILFLVGEATGIIVTFWYLQNTRMMCLRLLEKTGSDPKIVETVGVMWTQAQLVALGFLGMSGLIIGAIVVVREINKTSELKVAGKIIEQNGSK